MSSTNKTNSYAKPIDEHQNARDESVKRLKLEVRDHVRALHDFEILSVDWLRMAESVGQVKN